jgi:hypothetical protein
MWDDKVYVYYYQPDPYGRAGIVTLAKSLFLSFFVCYQIFSQTRPHFLTVNSFADLFRQKSAWKVTGNFLPHVLNVCFAKFTWIFLLF